MKKIILTFLLSSISCLAYAQTCNIVVPIKPGGATDIVARIMQKYNPNIVIDYKPGAYASSAISHVENNPSVGILTLPTMYSVQNPNKNPNIVLIKVFGSYDHGIVSNKTVALNDILTKKLNIGIPFFGSPAHVIGEQLKEKNPSLNLISFNGDTNALASVKNGEVDAYITAWPAVYTWTNEYKFKTLLKIPSGQDTIVEDIKLINTSIFAVFMSNGSTVEHRTKMMNCINTAINNESLKEDFKKIHMNLLNIKESEGSKFIQRYIDILNRYGI